jgi:hypothetical protein
MQFKIMNKDTLIELYLQTFNIIYTPDNLRIQMESFPLLSSLDWGGDRDGPTHKRHMHPMQEAKSIKMTIFYMILPPYYHHSDKLVWWQGQESR